jgi:hypothetical protein
MSAEKVSLPELINGMADCIFGFGQLLANKGLLDRAERAEAFASAEKAGAAQQEEIGGDVASRTLIARELAEAFSMPLVGDRTGSDRNSRCGGRWRTSRVWRWWGSANGGSLMMNPGGIRTQMGPEISKPSARIPTGRDLRHTRLQ